MVVVVVGRRRRAGGERHRAQRAGERRRPGRRLHRGRRTHGELRPLQLGRPHRDEHADGDHADGDRRPDGRRHPGAPASQRAAADRHLHHLVAERGDGHGDGDPGHEERVRAPVQPLPAHDEHDRPVPEIDAVGDPAELGQRRQFQEAHHRAAGRHRAAQHDPARRQTGQHEPAAEGERRGLRRRGPQHGRSRDTGEGQHRGGAGEPRAAGPLPPERQPDGERGADQQRLRSGVRSVVSAAGVPVGGRAHHEQRGGQRTETGDGEEELQPPAAGPCRVGPGGRPASEHQAASAEHRDGASSGPSAAQASGGPVSPTRRAELEHAQHDQRPHQVELLLNRQGPGVEEGRRLGGQREVARAGVNGVPVRDVEDRRERVTEDVRRGQDSGRDGQDDADDGDEQEQRGQEAPGAAGPEASEADRPGARPLLDQQGRDEESGEDEERVDAVEASGHRVEPGVEGDDCQYRKGPDAIEPANAAQPRVPPGCVSVRVHAASGPTVPGGVPPPT